MPRYIDADDIIVQLEAKRNIWDNKKAIHRAMRGAYVDSILIVKDAPTADVQEVKHGRWIENGKGSLICSMCGGYSALNCFNQHRVKTEYCPDCGAVMDGDAPSTKEGDTDEE